ncbi:YqcC family protein [Microbulbifer sp. 2201CG32-9]|uniref:YqcC family protein n=1 Tax=Microbulbifer sp. 2201CG32-9 TaxID=3232309 RepID=UPI00345BA1DD
MDEIYMELADQLLRLEAELRRLKLWSLETPTAEALASTEPFCLDTLTLPQWLQFVFLPRMRQLVESGQPLPRRCGIAPVAEEFFENSGHFHALIEQLREIDRRLERGSGTV